jgi:hypothetical protein
VIQELDGIYTNCSSVDGVDRSDGTPWVVSTSPSGTTLSVVTNDVACELIATGATASGTTYVTPQRQVIGGNFHATADQFMPLESDGGVGPIAYYENGYMNPDDYSSDFVLYSTVSDQPNINPVQTDAGYGTVTNTSISLTSVTAPSYTFSNGLAVTADINDMVLTQTGSFYLYAGLQPGEGYVVTSALAGGPSFAQIDAAYSSGVPTPIPGGSSPTIAASLFNLVGYALPLMRSVIVLHAQNGVKSYEVFTVVFNAP